MSTRATIASGGASTWLCSPPLEHGLDGYILGLRRRDGKVAEELTMSDPAGGLLWLVDVPASNERRDLPVNLRNERRIDRSSIITLGTKLDEAKQFDHAIANLCYTLHGATNLFRRRSQLNWHCQLDRDEQGLRQKKMMSVGCLRPWPI
eukprot:scaffold139779_cov23-Prasinocladus_malaysianus.AAC.1